MSVEARLVLLLGMLALSACATWEPVNQKTASSTVPNSGYTVTLPQGWMRMNLLRDSLMVTRDGVAVQYIQVSSLDPSTAFESVRKQSKQKRTLKTEELLPEQLAELTLAEIQAEHTLGAVTVIENVPATIDGQPAFRLHVQYKSPKGLRIEKRIYGMSDGKRVLLAVYRAPTLHFFARDLPAFEDTVKSLRQSEVAKK